MFNKRYKYHVAFNFQNGTKTGMGSAIHITNIKTNTSEAIETMRSSIERDCKFDNIVIINMIKLR